VKWRRHWKFAHAGTDPPQVLHAQKYIEYVAIDYIAAIDHMNIFA